MVADAGCGGEGFDRKGGRLFCSGQAGSLDRWIAGSLDRRVFE